MIQTPNVAAKKDSASCLSLVDEESSSSSLAIDEETAEDIALAKMFTPAQRMLWFTDSKRDHVDKHMSDENSPCDTAEVLLQRGLNFKTMTQEEEYALFSAYKSELDPLKKVQLRDEFLCRNLRLVMHLAKQQSQKCGYPPKELMAWGTMGMIRAFEKFSLTKGAKFSTYAARWITQGITRGLAETQRTIRIPYNIVTDQGKLKKYEQNFRARNGVDASDEEICDVFGWTQKKLEYVRKGLQPISSIDVPATDGEDTIADLIEDTKNIAVEDEVCNNIQRESILKALDDTLDDRARDVILNLFDFYGRESLDKAELAEKYGLTPERILQIRDEAISLLRHPAKSRKLRGFLAS